MTGREALHSATFAILGLALSALLLAGGCGKKGAPVAPEDPPPAPSNPQQDRSSVPPK
jgi:hypothetical protein